jgi:hypothetical protein
MKNPIAGLGVVVCLAGLLSTEATAQTDPKLDNAAPTYTRQTIIDWLQVHKNAQPAFKPGDTLGYEDLDKIRPFLPLGFFEQFVFEGVQFRITAPGNYSPLQHPAYAAATEKYCGQTEFTADGQLTNRDRGKPCGFPPPTPPGIRVRTRAVRSGYLFGGVIRRSNPI